MNLDEVEIVMSLPLFSTLSKQRMLCIHKKEKSGDGGAEPLWSVCRGEAYHTEFEQDL